MELREAPVARVEMLVRRPVAEVFRAFVDPAVTTGFWFTRGSGPLREGGEVRWDWEMYGVGTTVRVLRLDPDRRILIEWDEPATRVEWEFTPRGDDATLVRITNSGFSGDGDEVVRQALDATGGFSLVLAGAKALLEHGVALNLVADHAPDAHVAPGAAPEPS